MVLTLYSAPTAASNALTTIAPVMGTPSSGPTTEEHDVLTDLRRLDEVGCAYRRSGTEEQLLQRDQLVEDVWMFASRA